MNAQSMVVSIVFIGCLAWVFHAWVISGRSGGRLMDQLNESLGGDFDSLMGENRETVTKLKTLEERIEVLERIVTDRKYDLNNEIDKLRTP